ncbi:hypothetical protein FQN49_006042 [Arthroderma sp. PD_2]|nr:hypothetical protein FQN49_006042 [Arthroderma sp. PD_2]
MKYHISNTDLIAKFAHIFTHSKRGSSSSAIPPLTIFGGDVFSPSTESSVLKGEHMVPVLNHLNIDLACYGNHDFDFGEHRLIELSKKTNFPWLLSNVVHTSPHVNPNCHWKEEKLLGLAQEYAVKMMGQYKIGFIGLAGTDWPSNCQHLPPSHFLPPIAVAQRLAKHLRTVEGCDFVIAITHMRLAEDLSVSNATTDGEGRIDLLLGGHDHEVICRYLGDTDENPGCILQGMTDSDSLVRDGKTINVEGDVRVIKSGTDWRSYSVVKLNVERKSDGKARLNNVQVTQFLDITRMQSYHLMPKCPKIPLILESVQDQIMDAVRHPLFHTHVPLDGRSSIIRSEETNLGNMLADAVRAFYDTDIAFINSGGVRCDRIIRQTNGHNALKVKDIIDIVPFDNAFVVKSIRGATLLIALENSVSDSHTDGRFLQVSGMRFTASWQRPEGSRVLEAYFQPEPKVLEKIDPERMYTIAMVSFIATGFDGYDCFKHEKTLVDAESAMTDTSLMLQVFRHSISEDRNSDASKLNDDASNSNQNTDAGEEIGESSETEEEDDRTEQGVRRARESIITGYDGVDGLPVISPAIDGRLIFV